MANYLKLKISNLTVADIENLLREFPNFNISDVFIQLNPNGTELTTTLTHHALQNNKDELLDYLINANVDLNVSVPGFGTALLLVASWGNLKMVEKLLKAGAHVNAQRTDIRTTPLIEAVMQGYFDVAKCLIENGADVHAVTILEPGWGHTAVLIATSKRYNNIVELLLKNGADPCAEIELSNLNAAGVKNILSTTPNININSIFICRRSEFHISTTLAHLAVVHKNEELLDYVINAGADLNISIPDQGTALQVAAKMGNLDLVKKLCESGANVNNVRNVEWCLPPLIYAAKGGFLEVTKYLIEKRADVDAATTESRYDGFNALLFAADRGYTNIAEVLLENNANPNVISKSGYSPMMFSCSREDLYILKILLAHGAIYDCSIFRLIVLNRTVKILEYLLTLDVDTIDTYITDKKPVIPVLHYALEEILPLINYNNLATRDNIKVLLDAGVDVNSVNGNNKLALEITEDRQLIDIVKRHIVKLKQASIYVCQKNIKDVERGFDDFHTECLREIEKLKNNKIGTTNLVFYEVLHKSFHSLAIRLKHTNIDIIVNKDSLLDVYPIYGGMIYYKLAKAQRRIEISKSVEEFLDYVLNYCLKLPYTFIREVYSCLTNENLKKLIK